VSARFRPKVTIAIPVYNGANYLDQAIDSALAQTYRDLEVIVVNDGSTDDGATEAIARRYDRRITYIDQANQGVAGALNTAIAAMTGDVFTWLSHDDLHLPDKVATQVAYFNEIGKRDAVLISDVHLIDEEGCISHTQRWPFERFVKSPMLPLLLGCVNGCTVFIPVHILREVGPFDTGLRFTQDYDLWNKILLRCEFFLQPQPLVAHRFHPGRDSRKVWAVAEANALWMRLIDARSEIERVQMFGSSFRFFTEMADWLGTTSNRYAAEYARLRANEAKVKTFVSVVLVATDDGRDALTSARSVLEQTHRNLELVLVADPNGRGAFEALARTDGRIRLMSPERPGAELARNLGLDAAKGDYVAFLEPGDRFLPDKVEVQAGAMQDAGSLFSHTSCRISFPERFDRLGFLASGAFGGEVYPEILAECPIETSTVIVHRSLLVVGLRFEAEAPAGLDRLAWIWATTRYPLLGIDRALTVVAWARHRAPVNANEAWQCLRQARRSLGSDPVYGREADALARLRAAEAALRDTATTRGGLAPGSVLNEELIDAAFEYED